MGIKLEELTLEQKKELMKQVEQEEKNKKRKIQEDREYYKKILSEVVEKNFHKLKEVSEKLKEIKTEVFEDFEDVMRLKEELYGVKEKQQSHTFTTEKGLSVVIGHRVIDNFDDTVHAGIEKVKGYISKITAGEKAELEELINLLLKKDKNGNLKASRVLELERIANKISDEELTDGVNIIKEAYKPSKSSSFIEIYYKNNEGKRVNIPLSVTGAD